jgi:hypothetical protein
MVTTLQSQLYHIQGGMQQLLARHYSSQLNTTDEPGRRHRIQLDRASHLNYTLSANDDPRVPLGSFANPLSALTPTLF